MLPHGPFSGEQIRPTKKLKELKELRRLPLEFAVHRQECGQWRFKGLLPIVSRQMPGQTPALSDERGRHILSRSWVKAVGPYPTRS